MVIKAQCSHQSKAISFDIEASENGRHWQRHSRKMKLDELQDVLLNIADKNAHLRKYTKCAEFEYLVCLDSDTDINNDHIANLNTLLQNMLSMD